MKFAESIITNEYKNNKHVDFDSPKFYRCINEKVSCKPNERCRDSVKCNEVPQLISKYCIKFYRRAYLLVSVHETSVYERINDNNIATLRSVNFKSYYSFMFIPFFNWTGWGEALYSGGKYMYRFPDCDNDCFLNEVISYN